MNTPAPVRVLEWQRPFVIIVRQYCHHVRCPLLCLMLPFSGTSSLFYQTHSSFICLTRQVLISPSLGAVQCIAGRPIKFWITHWIPFTTNSVTRNGSFMGSFTLSESESEHESEIFLWFLSLLNLNIKLDSLWTHLEVVCSHGQKPRSIKMAWLELCGGIYTVLGPWCHWVL